MTVNAGRRDPDDESKDDEDEPANPDVAYVSTDEDSDYLQEEGGEA